MADRPKTKDPVEKLKKFVEEVVEGMKQFLDPPRPVRIPVTVGVGPRRLR